LRDPAAYGARRIEEYDGEDWIVQQVTGSGATKTYRCPGCDHEIRPATPHVVAFPADAPGGVEARRHWHSPCWAKRSHRGPRRPR
jgi:tRNA(Ile2) C34 agmatinyltransferase TiaS